MAQMLYTYLRRRKTSAFSVAVSNEAAAPSYREKESQSTELDGTMIEKSCARYSEDAKTICSSDGSFCDDLHRTSEPVAIFPQYTTSEQTTITIKEDMLPFLPGSFTVYQGSRRVFEIDRERPSLTRRTNIIDATSQKIIMTVRKNICTVPVSFSFEDASGKRVVDLQGEFFVPYSGAQSTAHMVNAETGNKMDLTMKGSYMNRHAVIKDEHGDVLVRMISNVFEARNLVGHRRTYELKVRAGVDLSLAVAMIVALHDREER
jgi:uncharacterized protein YxjI